ncbi:hypothetical protein KD909_15080 (plasmid) [Exiguobacterium sp. PFWT01]|uniref:hypothetical protein n=1 Tax=Exiguobacterium sp. PFWT01 TaxID=2829816 RepID=UPI001BAB6CE8|nr:hypothetical protein [Exiguobacterium sp. PFWT01]QUP88751.1 hypothetical protein KD909_15080 [Exiguobacterium sp. PFWT01]
MDPLAIAIVPLVTLLFTVISYVLAKKRRSNLLYVTAIVYVYLTEISLMYTLFVYYLSSGIMETSYNETSSIKVFIDFYTIYQIGVIVYIKSIDNISSRPYEEYLSRLKKIQMRLEADDWSGLQLLWADDITEKPNYLFNEEVEMDHEETYKQLRSIILSNGIGHHFDLTEDYIGKEINEFRLHLNKQIHNYEGYIEEKNSHWSGSLFLRYYKIPLIIYNLMFEGFKGKQLVHDSIKFISTYRLIIINLLIILTLIISFCYY